jgi:cytochrome c
MSIFTPYRVTTAVVASGLIAAACGGLDYPAAPPPPKGSGGSPLSENCNTIKQQAQAVLQTNCAGCHQAPNKSGNFDYVLDTDHLKSAGLLVPGNPEGSRLYQRVAAGEMPPAGQTQRPTNSDTTVLYQWIKVCATSVPPDMDGGVVDPTTGSTTGAAGATGAGGSTTGAGGAGGSGGGTLPSVFIDNITILRWISADISTMRAADQPFQRYFSLAHLRNAGATDDQMDLNRYGMAKAINALSNGTQIVIPWSIDKYNTVFRIDTRDLEWDATSSRADKWDLLVRNDPYAIEFVDDPAPVIKTLTTTKVFLQQGNWLVYGGMQPPLYHDVVGIPATLNELQRLTGVNIAQDILREQVQRSGFTDSGIALHNRVIERHEIPAGGSRVFWTSYDFANNGGKENIFSDPLDFQNDAGETIFSLPNGMHAYMLSDAAGNRLDVANTAVAIDRSQRDATVRNGISCARCHSVGFKNKQDEVGPFVASSFNFDATTKDTVAALYTAPNRFTDLVNADNSAFLGSVQKLTPPPSVTVEPIGAVFDKFDEDVDLAHAAAELGVQPKQLLTQLGRLDPALAPLEVSTVKRDTWKAVFANTVCLLKIGLANDGACRGSSGVSTSTTSTTTGSRTTTTGAGGAGGAGGSAGAGGSLNRGGSGGFR